MGYNTRKMKDRACELAEGYDEARDEAFNEEFDSFVSPYIVLTNDRIDIEGITEDDVQGFLDSFTFPEEGEWAMDKALSEADDIGDMKYEEMRDREMGL